MKELLKRQREHEANETFETHQLHKEEDNSVNEKKEEDNEQQDNQLNVKQPKYDNNNNIETMSLRLSNPFRADFNDHFETSIEALRDIMVVIDQLRQLVRPSSPEDFIIYDPYYCAGNVVRHWNTLGIQRVIHENRDFYKDIKEEKVPRDYDMLVTNPPFSGDHIERLFNYLVSTKKPFAFLVPDYTATKEWYKKAVRKYFTPAPSTGKGDINAPRRTRPIIPAAVFQPPPFINMNSSITTTSTETLSVGNTEIPLGNTNISSSVNSIPLGTEPFYLVPRVRYDFQHPKGVGNEHSHFRSMWFVWAGRRTAEVMRGAKVEFTRASRISPIIVHGIEALAEGQHIAAGTRQNPKRRAKRRNPRG